MNGCALICIPSSVFSFSSLKQLCISSRALQYPSFLFFFFLKMTHIIQDNFLILFLKNSRISCNCCKLKMDSFKTPLFRVKNLIWILFSFHLVQRYKNIPNIPPQSPTGNSLSTDFLFGINLFRVMSFLYGIGILHIP